MKKILLIILFFIGLISLQNPKSAHAGICPPNNPNPGCQNNSDCNPPNGVGPYICKVEPNRCYCFQPVPLPPGDNPFGTIDNPISGGSLGPNGGLITLLNNVLRLIFIGSGIYAVIRILGSGLAFMNAGGDPKKIQQAWDTIWQSLVGVVIIISSIAIAALIGLLLFGDATAILNPQIYGPSQ